MYIQMIMRKLGKEKCREQIVCEMLEDTDIEESQVFDIYNLVSANIGRTAEEIYELYEGEM